MDSVSEGDGPLRRRIRQQEVVAELGQRALETDDIDRLLEETSSVVAETLGVEYAKVLELRSGDDALALRAGVGWQEGLVGSAAVPTDTGSQAGYTLLSEEPVVVDDLDGEDRFSGPDLLVDHGVVSGISVVIGSPEEPWGILGVHATEKRAFTPHDGNFVKSVANVLASAIESEQRRDELEEIHGRISDAFFALDEDWEFTYLNDRAEELINPENRELIGHSIWDVFPAATRYAFESRYERAVADDEAVTFEEYYPEPLDGWFEVRAYPSETELSVYFRDVTDREKRERELELFRRLVDHSNDGMFVIDPESGRFLDVNETACRRLEYDRAELLERSVPDIETELPDHDAWRSFLEELRTRSETTFEGAHVRADGSTFPVEVNVSHVELDREYVFAIARDVTERRRRERDLERSERRYRTLAECFPNGIVALFDDDLEFTLAAGRAFEDLPMDANELEGRHVREIGDGTVADALEPSLRATLEGAENTIELEYADRSWRVHTVPVTDESESVVVGMAMAQDVTEQNARERSLREAKSQLEAATDAGAVGTWEWQIPEDRFVTGTSFARQFGVDPDAAREGVSLEAFLASIHGADRERVERKIEATIESCGEYEAEYRVRNADGEFRWVVARGHVECDADGNPATFPGALIDITRRKRAERKLEEQRRQLETLFEVLPVGVVVAETDGRLVEANDAAAEIWGGDVFDAETVADYERYDGWWADTGEPIEPEEWPMSRVLEGETVLEPDVVEIETANGDRRTVMIHGMPIRDENGEVVRGVLTQTDVTERREYRRRLEESEQRYRTLVENFPNGVVALFDDDLRYTAAGGSLIANLGIDRESAVGKTIYERYPEELVETVKPYFEGALEGEENTFEVSYAGRELWAHTIPVRTTGATRQGMLVVQDVTERREYQRRLEASNERLEQFAYAASHDLQEPLRMITSYLGLIESRYADVLDEDGKEFLEFAVDGAERMRAMIDGLLEYSRVETQGDPFEPVELDEALEDALTDLRLRVEESDAEITIDSLPRIEGDEDQLRQVFQNLLENAITYSGDEPPRIHVEAERTDSGWKIDIHDEGIGIDSDEQARVFEVFQRLHSHDEHGGTGIGLALCRRIIERHDGEIAVDSEPGEGSTFTIRLPEERDR
ncbi:PAS/PAC sensor signal transduction histidine kinase [Natronococcus amylolyticus DSM 10524]|uniref:histidine kinase n=1 Tax=Natronococcus amylolyticus DSM 10524 TaxID=1227497 RepID=L9XF08_9EURY|nr:PAS domain S-box protein [Natronococcus amylolyticus]ELY60305.1 PAS/PAC sensor signal transduction histidine kinase [Natronococcus amylolyticus DSM 10524]